MDLKGAAKLVSTLAALPVQEFETVVAFATELRGKAEAVKVPAKRGPKPKAAKAAAPAEGGKRRGRPKGTKNKVKEQGAEAAPVAEVQEELPLEREQEEAEQTH